MTPHLHIDVDSLIDSLVERTARRTAELISTELRDLKTLDHGATEFLTTREAAAYLKCSAQTLASKRHNGEGVPYCRFGRLIRYRRGDLDMCLATDEHLRDRNEARK